MVDAFQDSNGDGCGDLAGLTSRLDYLARLGVTCLWLNPIQPSPQRDGGYDVSDYYGIDPRLSTLGDFVELATQARGRGIRLLLELVVNHTSDHVLSRHQNAEIAVALKIPSGALICHARTSLPGDSVFFSMNRTPASFSLPCPCTSVSVPPSFVMVKLFAPRNCWRVVGAAPLTLATG